MTRSRITIGATPGRDGCLDLGTVHPSRNVEEESDVLPPLCGGDLNPTGCVVPISSKGLVGRQCGRYMNDDVVLTRLGINFHFHRHLIWCPECVARDSNGRQKIFGRAIVRTEILAVLRDSDVIDNRLGRGVRPQAPRANNLPHPKFGNLKWQTDFGTGWGGDSVYNGEAAVRVGSAALRSKPE